VRYWPSACDHRKRPIVEHDSTWVADLIAGHEILTDSVAPEEQFLENVMGEDPLIGEGAASGQSNSSRHQSVRHAWRESHGLFT
jgi:hypothetical protein